MRERTSSLSRLRSLSRSRPGVVGVLLAAYVVYDVVHQFLDFLRDVAYTTKHAGPVVDVLGTVLNFLMTGLGNLVAIIVAALLILWALRTQPDEDDSDNAATTQANTAQDAAQLRTKLSEARDRIEQLELENETVQADRESDYDLQSMTSN